MKSIYLIITLLISVLMMSCIKDEAPNAEADIVKASLENGAEILSRKPTVNNTYNYVNFELNDYQDDYNFAPQFDLTPGATIEPASGTTRDFTDSQEYTVTSEDGEWHKTYEVSFTVNEGASFKYSFEQVDTVSHYQRFYNYNSSGQKTFQWDSGNEGFDILADGLAEDEGVDLTPEFYPTSQTSNGFEGKAAKLVTKNTGALGAMMNSPMAAGNLFLGTFQLTFPSINSPRFGQPYKFDKKPVALTGYFKYKAGDDFVINNDSGSDLTQDKWDAYAILFEKSEEDNYLPGDHNFEDPRMVRVAHIDPAYCVEADSWTEFYIPFKDVNGKSFDPNKAYMYTIVFTSSTEGAYFNGADGSTLWIDEVELITED